MSNIKQYLEDVFVYDSKEDEIEFYKTSVQGKGEVLVEYNIEDEVCSIIHTDRSGRENFYEADNLRDLKETVEYCLGPMISDKDWNVGKGKNDLSLDEEDWDEYQ
jgi:hypothetical protein